MDKIRIQGPCRLRGTVRASGAKNAVLPEMAATLLLEGPVTLRNVPVVRDVQTMVKVLRHLGVRSLKLEGNSLSAEGGAAGDPEAPYDLVRTMRASILVLGPLLARLGRAKVSLPGGRTVLENCALEPEVVDLARFLNACGARIDGAGTGRIVVEGVARLRGTAHTVIPDRIETGTFLMAAAATR